MLGFSPVAGLPLAQVPQAAATTIALVADPGAYTITGQATATHFAFAAAGGAYAVTGQSIVFGGSFKAQSGAYALTGNSVTLRSYLAADAGQYSIISNDATMRTRQPAEGGSYSITGSAISFGTRFGLEAGSYTVTGTGTLTPIVMVADGGRYVWTLGDFTLIRTGDDTEQVYGGVGHYLEEVERLKRLQAITRVPPPAVFKPMPPMRRTITPQRPAPAVAQPQIDTAAVAKAAALKRQQQEAEIILLLAS